MYGNYGMYGGNYGIARKALCPSGYWSETATDDNDPLGCTFTWWDNSRFAATPAVLKRPLDPARAPMYRRLLKPDATYAYLMESVGGDGMSYVPSPQNFTRHAWEPGLGSGIQTYPFKSLSEIETIYQNKTLAQIKSDFYRFTKLAMYWHRVRNDVRSSGTARVKNRQYVAQIRNIQVLLGTIYAQKKAAGAQEQADTAAVAAGYQSAADAKALREVEIEHYFNLYGTSDPIQILAFQEIEKKRFGKTSYQALLAGETFVLPPTDTPEVMEVTATMKQDVATAQEADRKKKVWATGLGIVGLVGLGYLLLRKK